MNYDTILNSLSAIEAGKIDEIIQKANEAREGGLDGGLAVGPAKVGGSRKRNSTVQEELVRTRTRFSAFDAWHKYLDEANAIGTFDSWDMSVRNELTVGDTIRFQASISIAPLHKLFRTYISFASNASNPNSPFHVKGKELQDLKKSAALITEWAGGKDGSTNLAVYFRPGRVAEPKIVGRLEDQYIIGAHEAIEGQFTVLGQVEQILEGEDVIPTIRVIRDVPPTPKEIEVSTEAMLHMIEPAKELGVEIDPSDLSITSPAVIFRPVAIFQ